MVDSAHTLCHDLREYMRKTDNGEEANLYFVSLSQSLKCGCEYCTVACTMVGKESELDKNKRNNQIACEANATLSSGAGTSSANNSDDSLKPRVTGSGLQFRGDIESRELFVLDREYLQYVASQHQHLIL